MSVKKALIFAIHVSPTCLAGFQFSTKLGMWNLYMFMRSQVSYQEQRLSEDQVVRYVDYIVMIIGGKSTLCFIHHT